MLRPTPGDPWGVEQHHWNTGAEENQQLKTEFRLNRCKGGMRGLTFSSIPMNRLSQTESAVFDSCISSVISKDPFSDCGHLNVS